MRRFILRFLLYVGIMMFLLSTILFLGYDSNHYMTEYDHKISLLHNPDRQPAIVLLGGSATTFGYNSALLEQETGMPVINAALHADLGQHFILHDILPYLQKDDILVYSPEAHSFTYGGETLDYLLMYSRNMSLRSLTAKHWGNIFHYAPSLLNAQLKHILHPMPGSPVYARTAFNSYGDDTAHWSKDECLIMAPLTEIGLPKLDEQCIAEVCQTLHRLPCRLILYPAQMSHRLYAIQQPLVQEVDSVFQSYGLHYEATVQTEVLPDSLFFDTDFHLRRIGAEQRSHRLANIINQHL